jgi:hypothetical protein
MQATTDLLPAEPPLLPLNLCLLASAVTLRVRHAKAMLQAALKQQSGCHSGFVKQSQKFGGETGEKSN